MSNPEKLPRGQREPKQPDEARLRGTREDSLSKQFLIDQYKAVEETFMAKVEQLQQTGEMRRPSEITSEEEQDDHFDQLARLYEQTCLEMGLPWPPLVSDDEGEPQAN